MRRNNLIHLLMIVAVFLVFSHAAFALAPDSKELSVAVGGFDPARKSDLPGLLKQLDTALPRMKSIGATSHEGYVRWNLIEPEKGKFDFSVYDPIVDLYRKYGMKWVPFLIIGSPYSLPDWYYNSKEKQGYICLEHGMESDVQSLWNPVMRNYIDRMVKAFADHYRDTGVVESVLIGVTGNYGEAIYPASGNDWTSDIHGQYHTHAGYWASDPFAQADFRRWLTNKYGTVSSLNAAWKSDFKRIDDIKPAIRASRPSGRVWYDFITWYRESMNDYTDFWVRTVRKYFPDTQIYICTGGDANPMHGSDFGAQSRIAAKYKAGVRITNEGSDYALNFSITRWVASASRLYGAYFAFEPAGFVDEHGVVARIYNVTASDAGQLHTYWGNVFDTPQRETNWKRELPKYRRTSPLVDIAVYYSKAARAYGAEFYSTAREIRDYFDYDIVDDGMISAGALKNHRVLLWPAGGTAEEDSIARIAQWVATGGTLLFFTGGGAIRTPDGAAPTAWPPELSALTDESAMDKLNRGGPLTAQKIRERMVFPHGAGHVVVISRSTDADTMLRISPMKQVFRWMFEGKLGFAPQTAEAIDFDRDSIYFTLVDGGRTLMVLSQAQGPKDKEVRIGDKTISVHTVPDEIMEVKTGN